MTNNTKKKFSDFVSSEELIEFERDLQEPLKRYQVPGVAFAIVHGNHLIRASGYGVRDLETNAPVTPETLFPIGSMTKSMTAVMNATQVEAGIFGWETLVKDISPHFKFADRRTTDNLQVQHVIGMRSGMLDPIGPYHKSENNKYWEGQSAPYVIRSLASAPFERLPGEIFHYGNESYASTGYLSPLKRGVEASQLLQEYNNLMRKHIFAPIGMTNTYITPICSSTTNNYAASYGLDTSNGQASQMAKAPISISNVSGIAPAGQVVSNVVDLSRYARMLLNHGVIDGKQILRKESLEKLWTDTISAPGFPGLTNETEYGLGWEIQKVKLTNPDRTIDAIAHGGLLPSWVSWLMVVPDINAGLIICTNSWAGFYLIFEKAKNFLKLFYGDHLDESQFVDYRLQYDKYINDSAPGIKERVSSYTVNPDEVKPLLGNYQGGWNLEVNQHNQLVLFKTGWVFYLFPSKAGQDDYFIGASNDTSYLNPDHLDDERNKIRFSIDPISSQVTMISEMGGIVTKLV
ncbi:serine hydrolase domain-containing protein [Microcoleus sp. F10-C6]|uniref:serine hydrolase domain-containing protein n=1 Tax=unclassified Microcoleus TaxID=2642155 RepID=UPI002FCF1270